MLSVQRDHIKGVVPQHKAVLVQQLCIAILACRGQHCSCAGGRCVCNEAGRALHHTKAAQATMIRMLVGLIQGRRALLTVGVVDFSACLDVCGCQDLHKTGLMSSVLSACPEHRLPSIAARHFRGQCTRFARHSAQAHDEGGEGAKCKASEAIAGQARVSIQLSRHTHGTN